MKRWLVGLLAMVLVICGGTMVNADELPFSVTPVLPVEQKTGVLGYFDLVLPADAEKRVYLKLENPTEDKLTLSIQSAQAKTNANGVVDYQTTTENPRWQAMVSHAKKAALQAGEVMYLPIDIKMPKESYRGVIAGGISIREIRQKTPSNETLSNQFEQTTALILKNESNLLEGALNVEGASFSVEGNSWQLNLLNPVKTFHHDGKLKLKVAHKGRTVQVIERKQLQFAPDDRFHLNFDNTVADLEPGRYQMVGKITTDKGSWDINQTIIINPRMLGSATKAGALFNWQLVVVIVVPVFLLLLLVLALFKIRKLQQRRN